MKQMGKNPTLFRSRWIGRAWANRVAYPEHQVLRMLLSSGAHSLSKRDSSLGAARTSLGTTSRWCASPSSALLGCKRRQALGVQAGMQSSLLNLLLRLLECWLLFHRGKIVSTLCPCSLFSYGWRRRLKERLQIHWKCVTVRHFNADFHIVVIFVIL